MSGLLIVNADDFGGNRPATDRILECFAAGRITSTSAMVYMDDSRRAAQLARLSKLPIGLHLNLTQELEDSGTPPLVRERQARAAEYFARARRRRVTYNTRMATLVKTCVADQLACFRELFGIEPTHIDGHNHAHLSPTALFSLPRGIPVRTGESDIGRGIGPGTLLRGARHAMIARRHPTTDYFFAIDRLGQLRSEQEIERLLAFAQRSSVEIMTHPDRNSDYRVLTSDTWQNCLQRHTSGSFRELGAL
ncbi:MAG TPA: ChbG/HpnK family deacetylase [Solirubrobacteraceae bacterium]|jgi:predicted glycoside hydrolase/deacetylase ChbG (UPF0249 family)|nr:ChbG/HpnK family deacetylase [Solirubrobacteraceae bacterium]